MSYLVIGYGNPLRSDDAAGQRIAETVAGWNLASVRSLPVHQLTPELADPLSKVHTVIFVDVYVAHDGREDVQVLELAPLITSKQQSGLGHASDPRSLLTLAQHLYGASPVGWWILVPAANFEFGEQLSSVTQNGIAIALQHIQRLTGIEN
ncbi:MAG: hydrogenase maturation protease [Leptolyngbyaceae cyanobacterium bins.349]|nr:hydrogenase maturation protease [Leptolyngbyaceae cyanobacterium bins.349]